MRDGQEPRLYLQAATTNNDWSNIGKIAVLNSVAIQQYHPICYVS